MAVKDNVELIKEQLRVHKAELKKRDAQRHRQETRFKHLIAVSNKKIHALEHTLEEQKEQVKLHRGISVGRDRFTPSAKGVTPKDQTAKDKEHEKQEVKKEDQDPIRYAKLNELLQKTKKKNETLTKLIQEERKERNRLDKQKSTLSREIIRLRNQIKKPEEIKEKVKQVEVETDESKARFDKLLKEKDGLIKLYEKLIQSSQTEEGALAMSSRMVSQIQRELDTVREEKEDLMKEIETKDKQYQAQLTYEIQQAEERLRRNLKVRRMQKRSLSEFSEDVMEDRSSAPWLMTFADMFTLLLTYFIILYSVSSTNMNKFKEAILGEERASVGLLELMDSVEIKESLDVITGMRPEEIIDEIKEVAEQESMSEVMDVDTEKSKITIKVPSQSLFDQGSADLNLKKGKEVLDELIRIIGKYPYYKIKINGHTDDTQVSTDRFPTNWELSSARATAVLRYFVDKNIDPRRMTASGFADQYPIATNKTERGRAINRRVEFVLEKEKY